MASTANTNSTIEDRYDNEGFINDDRFASILNAEGEVLVENRVYKYTEDGLYIVDEEDKEYLNNYIANNANGAPLPTGLSQIDSKIQAYLPPRDKFDDLGIGIWGLMILIAFLQKVILAGHFQENVLKTLISLQHYHRLHLLRHQQSLG